jgi:hypothetical protein
MCCGEMITAEQFAFAYVCSTCDINRRSCWKYIIHLEHPIKHNCIDIFKIQEKSKLLQWLKNK